MDIPFASDCIRTKKVSSAPSYDVEGKDDVIVNFEASDSGIQQWCEAIEKHMPLILCHSSAMVRMFYILCHSFVFLILNNRVMCANLNQWSCSDILNLFIF